MKRLLIVADHKLVVHAIRMALRQTAGFTVVGFVDGRHDISAHLEHTSPEVVVIDEMSDPAHAICRLRQVGAAAPGARTILLTGRMEERWLDEAFEAGATTVVSKTVHAVALGTLLRETVQGNIVHRPRRAPSTGAQDCPLTARELEILRLAAQGYTNGRIARELWVAEQTVKFHLSNTYRKLGVANRTEATGYLHINDLLPDVQLAS